MSVIDELQRELQMWYASFLVKQEIRVEAVVRAALEQRDVEAAEQAAGSCLSDGGLQQHV